MYKKYDNLYRKYWGGVAPLPPCSCAESEDNLYI